MNYSYLTVALLVALAVLAAGCTGGGTSNATTRATTAAPATSGAVTAATTAAAVTTTAPGTLQSLPTGLALAVSVNRQPYNRAITVAFNGGAGQGSVTSLEATVVRSDGTTETKSLAVRSGSEAIFTGSSGTDTVYVTTKLTNGNTYRFFSQALE